jgi:hypothetical protein
MFLLLPGAGAAFADYSPSSSCSIRSMSFLTFNQPLFNRLQAFPTFFGVF